MMNRSELSACDDTYVEWEGKKKKQKKKIKKTGKLYTVKKRNKWRGKKKKSTRTALL
jgi:hypothetical protein